MWQISEIIGECGKIKLHNKSATRFWERISPYSFRRHLNESQNGPFTDLLKDLQYLHYLRTYFSATWTVDTRYYDIGLNLPTLNFLYLQKVHASSGLATVPEWPWDVEGGGSRTRDWQLPSSPLVDCVVSGSWWKFTRVVLSFFY